MARTWLSITVELVSGQGLRFWPRPGRVFVASRSHTFAALATAINDGFARWDHAHLSRFTLTDSTTIADVDPFFDMSDDSIDISTAKLSRLCPGEQFAYTFDFGDDWQHLCAVGDKRVDPEEVYGLEPSMPAVAGARFRTSTADAGPTTTANHRLPPTPATATCPRSCPNGDGGPSSHSRREPPSHDGGARRQRGRGATR